LDLRGNPHLGILTRQVALRHWNTGHGLLACSFAFGVQVIGGGITDRPVIGLPVVYTVVYWRWFMLIAAALSLLCCKLAPWS
jgi:hypothetical protein